MEVMFENSTTRDLHHRCGNGLEVSLLSEPRADLVFVAVNDRRTSVRFRISVDAADALEALHHPYGYGHRRHPKNDVAGRTRSEPAR